MSTTRQRFGETNEEKIVDISHTTALIKTHLSLSLSLFVTQQAEYISDSQ